MKLRIRIRLIDIVTCFIFIWIVNPMAVDFYNWRYFAAVCVVWLLLAYNEDTTSLQSILSHKGIIYYAVFELILILYALAGHRNFFFQSLTLPFVYMITQYYCSKHDDMNLHRYKFIYFVTLGYVISVSIVTIIALKSNPNMCRLLAGGSNAIATSLASPFHAGFSFVYSVMLLSVSELAWFLRKATRKSGGVFWGILSILQIICFSILIYKSQYTTALICLFLGAVATISFSDKTIVKLISICILGFGVFVLITGLLPSLLLSLADIMPEGEMKAHFIELSIASSVGSEGVSGLSRVSKFNKSLDYFFSNPLFGAGKAGNHNEIIDIFAENGIIGGIPYFMSLINMLKMTKRNVEQHDDLLCWRITLIVMIILFFLNPVSDGIFYLFIMGLIPIKYICIHKSGA